jgi:hypothetical protein
VNGVWITGGLGLPYGAREMDGSAPWPAPDGKAWLDVCILGDHFPRVFARGDIRGLSADGCARLGLCPDCLGFGDVSAAPAAGREACPNCGGGGRPAMRDAVRRNGAATLPHAYVPPLGDEALAGGEYLLRAAFGVPSGMCLECGLPEGDAGPDGEALHA